MIQHIVVATHNQGKWHEIRAALQSLAIQVYSTEDYAVPDLEETGLSFIENAILKARHTAQYTGLPALADDSGLVVQALNGAPGLYSARYAGDKSSAQQNNQKLLQELAHHTERDAYFFCAMALCRNPLDPIPFISQAHWHGRILHQAQGTQGFGYDPLFFVPTHNCSAAELPLAEKNKISHRGLALQQLVQQLKNQRSQDDLTQWGMQEG